MKTTPTSYIAMDFDEARRLKWKQGLNTHRNGDATAPFKGNLCEELREEMLDAVNYMEKDERDTGENWSVEISMARQIAAKAQKIALRRQREAV